MYRVLIFSFIAVMLYILGKWWLKTRIKKWTAQFTPRSRQPKIVDKGMMVKCVACETYIPMDTAIKDKMKGKIIYYCSKECSRSGK
jgi:hypothetical protein